MNPNEFEAEVPKKTRRAPQAAVVVDEEQAQSLAALQAEALGDVPPPAEEAPGVDQAAQWAALPLMIGSALSMAMPELAGVYTPAACQMWGEAMAPVAEKHGWSSDSLSPELALAFASLPLAVGTYMAISRRKAAAEASKAPAAPKPGALQDAPGSSNVVIGAPIVAGGGGE